MTRVGLILVAVEKPEPGQVFGETLCSDALKTVEPALETSVEEIDVLDVVDAALDPLLLLGVQGNVLHALLGREAAVVGVEGGEAAKIRLKQFASPGLGHRAPPHNFGQGSIGAIANDGDADLLPTDASEFGRSAALAGLAPTEASATLLRVEMDGFVGLQDALERVLSEASQGREDLVSPVEEREMGDFEALGALAKRQALDHALHEGKPFVGKAGAANRGVREVAEGAFTVLAEIALLPVHPTVADDLLAPASQAREPFVEAALTQIY